MDSYDIDAEWIREEHADLIAMVNDIYDTLIELRYFQSEEILRPPYGVDGKPALDKARLGRVGFTDEVIALMEQLPYPSEDLVNKFSHQDEGVPIAPDSSAVSYLDENHMSTARQPFCDGEVGIPAWAFKVTTGGLNFGNTYIYDTRLSQSIFDLSISKKKKLVCKQKTPPTETKILICVFLCRTYHPLGFTGPVRRILRPAKEAGCRSWLHHGQGTALARLAPLAR